MALEKAYKPEDLDRILIPAIERGDIETIVSLYEENAVLHCITPGGPLATTPAAIRKEFETLIAKRPKHKIESIVTVMHGDGTLATTRMKVSYEEIDENNVPKTIHVHTLEVVRKQADGSWKFAIDDPQGSAK